MSNKQPQAEFPSPFDRLPATDPESGLVNVVVETPRHSRCKFTFEEAAGVFRLHKFLPLGSSFPYDFGFIPSTRGDDGDPLDILVLGDEPLFSGCLARVKLIGVIEAEQTESNGKTERNDRLLGVIETQCNPAEITSIDQLSAQKMREIEQFFVSYNEMEGRKFRCIGCRPPEQALHLLEKGRKRAASPRATTAEEGSSPESAKQSPSPVNDSPANDSPVNDFPANDEQNGQQRDVSRSFSLKPKESFGKGIARIMRRQLERCLDEIPASGKLDEEAVHEVRKRFKRARAVVRLVRSELGRREYRRENEVFRDAGRLLTDVRNSKVLLEALRKLRERGARDADPELFDDMERYLKTRQEDLRRQLAHDTAIWDGLRDVVQSAQRRVKGWRLSANGRKTCLRGFRQLYRESRDAFEAAEADPTVENLHEWRKQAKYLYHELQILQRIARVEDFVNSLRDLAQVLGDDHDLAMMRNEVTAALDRGLPHAGNRLLTLIDENRGELVAQAFKLGVRLFRDDFDAIDTQIVEWSKRARPKAKATATA